jgi:chromosome segregation ATPase
LRDLMAASEDHAIVARLQQQLIHLKSNYQQFLLKYDNAIADQQQASMMRQHAELALENHAKTQQDAREKARAQILVLEASLQELKERDYVMRNTKWDVFKKRLDGLEADMRAEQDRRRTLEKELDEKQTMLPLGGGNPSSASVAFAAERSRLQGRIDALETRERVLMGQLDVLAKNATARPFSHESDEAVHLKKEVGELKRLHGELMRQLQSVQARNAELLQLNNDLETQKRAVQREKDDLEIDYQQLHAQWELQGGHRSGGGNQAESHSPIMRKKVGLYEKDHLEQQQAAQASIASLKQLLTEKNSVIAEYQKKITTLRADVAAAKAQERADATQLHKKLYEENQRMIAQLKDATDKIYHLEKTGSDKKALKAAQDRHEYVLQEWKRVEIELETAKSKLRELEMEIQSITNERDIAEARAGEALEEIVLNHEKLKALEKDKKGAEDQLLFVKREMTKREEKMQLLRDAIIKLKEEFLKAEDRHAIELAKAQNVVQSTKQSKSETERARDQWSEEKDQLEAQVQMLQEKLALTRKGEEKAKSEIAKLVRRQKSVKTRKEDSAPSGGDDEIEPKRSSSELEVEINRLKAALKDKVVGEARLVEELEKKIKVLQAQNLALRESSSAAPSTMTFGGEDTAADKGTSRSLVREQWEGEKRLQRRVDVVTMRLKEKQISLEKSEKECERLREKWNESESKLREMQRAASSARDAIQGSADAPAGSNVVASRGRGLASPDVDELARQNAFLQETLVRKRKEWDSTYQEQMEKYEEQLRRLRARLARRTQGDKEHLSNLEREERDFVAMHDVRDELMALGDELREKERLIVDKDTRLMDLELELESVRAEYQRLHRKATLAKPSNETLLSTTATTGTRRIKSTAQERLELEEVIENMKKVIEKLRSENEKLRKAAAAVLSPDKVEAMRRKLREARDARQSLQVEVEQLRVENSELKKDKLRLQQRVRSLSASRTDSSGPGSRATSSRRSIDEDTERLHQLQLAEKDAQIADLNDRIVKKDVYIRELCQRLAQAETLSTAPSAANEVESRTADLQLRVDELAHENEQLRHELSAFDQDFFEEIEDLKYKYAQAVRDKQRLERMVTGR